MKKVLKIISRVLLIFVISIASLFAVLFVGLNVGKFIIYSDYYSIKEDICENPGLDDDFVCQGIALTDNNEKIIVSGYMKDKSHSRLYVTDFESNSYYVSLTKNNKKWTGHAGGVAISNNTVYIANGSKIYTVELDDVLSAKEGDFIDIGEGYPVNNSASFVYTDDNYLYVGEFHDGGAYVTDHPYETNDGMYYAICSKYSLNDLSKPIKIYSIRNKVQGICFTPEGEVVLSTSYGLTDTIYYIYDEDDAVKSNHTLDGCDVYFLDAYKDTVHGPAMGEDLDYYNGKIITLTESASNKYIFGKFFFANKIVALDL